MSPVEIGTNNYCVGEGQQQFNRQADTLTLKGIVCCGTVTVESQLSFGSIHLEQRVLSCETVANQLRRKHMRRIYIVGNRNRATTTEDYNKVSEYAVTRSRVCELLRAL
jgi:hypothetical protein